jgi:glutamyl-tRNA reductase
MERLVNAVIQASKKIKTDTEISSATISFASVQYIIKNVEDIGNKIFYYSNRKKWNTCENLVKHTKMNRSL